MALSNNAPTNCKHKPIYEVSNYSQIDGEYKNDTDARALSIGLAQWRENENRLSVKVWRQKDNEHWSRQSEELTFTRAIDMATFIVSVLDSVDNSKQLSNILNDAALSGGLTNNVSIKQIAPNMELVNFLNSHNSNKMNNRDEIISHLKVLKQALDNYGI